MIGITHAELAAMPMPQAVVAFLRACRTYDDIGDIDGPWREPADRHLFEAVGVADVAGFREWLGHRSHDEVFAAYDRAIAAAEAVGNPVANPVEKL